jgi:hypothetical protein
MKYVLLLGLVACQTKSQPHPAAGSAAVVAPPAAPAPPVRPAELCTTSLAALDASDCAGNESGLRAARTSLEGIINTMLKTGGADPDTYAIMCGRMLLAIERDLGSAGCTVAIDPALRQRIQGVLDTYYNQRTPVTKTGDAASDEMIGKLAAVRDAACDCRTSACIDKLDPQLAALPTLPATAPQAARDLATKLLDDSARCAQRARM